MSVEELEQRRAELRLEIVDLLFRANSPGMAPLRRLEPGDPGRALLTGLEQRIEEKREQLRGLDARIQRASAPRARFRAECYQFRGVIWLAAVCACLAAVFCGLALGGGISILLGLAAPCSLAWAVWSSLPPPY